MKSIMDEEKISNIIDKVRMYKTEEDLDFESLKIKIKNINDYYDSENSRKLDTIIFELSNKLNIIGRLHNDNMIILSKNLEKYKTTKKEIAQMFDNIV